MAPGSEPMPPSTAAVKALTPARKPIEEVDDAVVEQVHHAGDRRQRGAHDEGQRDRAVDVDAEQRGHLHVLLARALGAAERRPGDEVA